MLSVLFFVKFKGWFDKKFFSFAKLSMFTLKFAKALTFAQPTDRNFFHFNSKYKVKSVFWCDTTIFFISTTLLPFGTLVGPVVKRSKNVKASFKSKIQDT